MTNYEANRERLVRSIETRLRGVTLTWEQCQRITRSAEISAAPSPRNAA